MSTQKEEIIVRAGFDNTALASGLRESGHAVKDFAKDVGRDLLAVFSAGAIMGQIETIFQKVKSLRAGAEKTGINVEDFQKLSTLANEELPDGAQKFETALTKLNVEIGEGSKNLAKWGIHSKTAEAAMYEIADRMKAMDDPAQRAAMAVDLMGRGGAAMVPLFEKGAAALKAMAATKPGWSETDMKAIADAHASIEETQNRFVIGIGKSIALFGNFFSMLGRLSTGFAAMAGDSKERAHEWMQEKLAAWDKKNAEAGALEDQQAAAALAEKQAEAMRQQNALADYAERKAEARADHEKEILKTQQEGVELNKKWDSLNRESKRVIHEIHSIDQETPTIADLAGRSFTKKLDKDYGAGGKFDLGKGDGPFAAAAQQYELAQKQQQWDIIHGNATFDKDGTLVGGAAFQDMHRAKAAHNMLGAAGLETPAMKEADMVQHLADIKTDMAKVAGAIIDNAMNAKILDDDGPAK